MDLYLNLNNFKLTIDIYTKKQYNILNRTRNLPNWSNNNKCLEHTIAIESSFLFDINSEPYSSWIVYNSEVCSRVINDAVRCWGLNRISEQRNIMAYD